MTRLAPGISLCAPMTADASLFGRLALHYKLITREHLQEVTAQQAREGGSRKLGELLLERGWLSQAQLDALLNAQREYLAKQARAAEAPALAPAATPTEAAAARLRRAEQVLEFAVKSGASDIHVHAGPPTRFRVHGRCAISRRRRSRRGDRASGARAARRAAVAGGPGATARSTSRTRCPASAASAPTPTGSSAASTPSSAPSRPSRRPSPTSGCPTSLAKLHQLPPGHGARHRPGGLRQVVDAGGAACNLINEERRDHIITIEDPIEYVHPSQALRGEPAPGRAATRRPSRARCARRCARTPTSSRSASCATSRPSRSRSPPPRPATWCSARCTPTAPSAPSTACSASSRRRSRSRSAPWSRSRCARSSRSAWCRAPTAAARVPALEILVVNKAVGEPDPREQDLPDPLGDADRRRAGHDAAWTTRSTSWSRRSVVTKRGGGRRHAEDPAKLPDRR